MRVRIDSSDGTAVAQVQRLVRLLLAPVTEDVTETHMVLTKIHLRAGRELFRCKVTTSLHDGSSCAVEERQANLHLAVTRALDRLSRSIQRRKRAA